MKVKLLVPVELLADGWVPVGTILEHPDAYMLAADGRGVALDDETEAAKNEYRKGKLPYAPQPSLAATIVRPQTVGV